MQNFDFSFVLLRDPQQDLREQAKQEVQIFFQRLSGTIEILTPASAHQGLIQAQGDVVVLWDARLSIPLTHSLPILSAFQESRDCVLVATSRWGKASLPGIKSPTLSWQQMHRRDRWLHQLLTQGDSQRLPDPLTPVWAVRRSWIQPLLPDLSLKDALILSELSRIAGGQSPALNVVEAFATQLTPVTRSFTEFMWLVPEAWQWLARSQSSPST